MVMATTSSPLLALPEDLLLRVLIGVPRADHGATAAACGAFRAVMSGPRFLRLRRDWGFAERGVVMVESEKGHLRDTELHGLLKIRTAHDGGVASVSIGLKLMARDSESTTDGGARLFLCINDPTKPPRPMYSATTIRH